MILQKSFEYADLLLKKHFLLLSVLKTFTFFMTQKNRIYLKQKSFVAI